MRRLIIADSHLGQRAGDGKEMAGLLERAAAAGVGEVVYLGDAFQYLIGLRKLWTAAVIEMLQIWQQLRAGGLRLVLVEGNRDFFLDEPELASYLDWSGRVYELAAGARRYRLVHGDHVNPSDLKYRFWSAVSKSGAARLLAQVMPQRLAMTIVCRMEAELARTNIRYRKRKPEQALRQQADQAWAEGIDVVLWGHFHSHWEYRRGEQLAMVVPAWLLTSAAVLVEADGAWSWVDSELRRMPGTPAITRL